MKILVEDSSLIRLKGGKKISNYKGGALSKEKILFYIFLLLPLIDSLNGYFIRNLNVYGIGSSYHILIVIALVMFTINDQCFIIGKFERLTCYLFISFILSFALNCFFGIKVTDIAIERSSKILCTAVMIASLYRLHKQKVIHEKFLENLIDVQAVMVSVIVLGCNLLGFYNYAYEGSGSGRIGLYSNLNELVLMFTIFIFHHIKIIFQEYANSRLILILISMINLMFTESKFALGIVVISAVLIIFRVIRLKRIRLKLITLSMLTIILPVGIYAIYKIYLKIINTLLNRQTYLYSLYASENIWHYLSSGRTTRFQELLVEPINKLLNSINSIDILQGIIVLFFGNGLSSSYYQTFEMDIMDVVLFSGLVGGTVFFIFNMTILLQAIKNQKKAIDCIGLLITMLGFCVVGHVWTGGVCGIYFAMLSVDFIKNANV